LVDVRSSLSSCIACWRAAPYVAEFFCPFVLPDLKKTLYEGTRRKTLRGIYLHHDMTRGPNAKWPQREIARTKATNVVHPVASPAVAPGAFFLFGDLKCEIAGVTASSPEDIFSEIHRIFAEVSKETLAALYNGWITSLECIIDHKGEYYPDD
jgi:hypothetical protein